MRCKDCHQPIPQERLEALPDTLTCVACSQVKPKTSNDVDVANGIEQAEFGVAVQSEPSIGKAQR